MSLNDDNWDNKKEAMVTDGAYTCAFAIITAILKYENFCFENI